MSHTKHLRTLLAQPDAFVAPGMFDALTALLVEQQGFSCAYLGGASIAYTRLGRPDIGLTSFEDVVTAVAQIRERVEIPFLVDADTGFGNALNVQRTVTVLERMGASGIQLEDQTMPKRCGHLAGKSLVSQGEMVGKIKAALDARANDDTVIIARTDAIAVEGFASATQRAEAYLEAGADVLFIEAPEDDQQMAALCENFGARIPLIANMVEGGRTPLRSAAVLGELGYKIVIYPGAMVRTLVHAGREYLAALHRDGGTENVRSQMLDFGQLNDIIGTDATMAAGRTYDPDL
jgi:2-methylisocitrate lyase-like PEP mutase family enzyme